MNKYITAGELAKLASTTKRTIHFYDEKSVLMPVRVDNNGYRYYEESQILEYQMILMLTKLGVSLDEIAKHLADGGELSGLFRLREDELARELARLEWEMSRVKEYLTNLEENGTMVAPQIVQMKPFSIYYIERVGSYSTIEQYCQKLLTMVEGEKLTTLAIFSGQDYQPKKSIIKIGVIAEGVEVKEGYPDQVKQMKFSPGKVLTYTHNGSGSTLSLFWKQLEKYAKCQRMVVRTDTPDFEIYRTPSSDETKQSFEIYLPIE